MMKVSRRSSLILGCEFEIKFLVVPVCSEFLYALIKFWISCLAMGNLEVVDNHLLSYLIDFLFYSWKFTSLKHSNRLDFAGAFTSIHKIAFGFTNFIVFADFSPILKRFSSGFQRISENEDPSMVPLNDLLILWNVVFSLQFMKYIHN